MTASEYPLPSAISAGWITIGIVALVVLAFGLFGPFELAWRTFIVPASATALLAGGGWYYRAIRHKERLGAVLTATGQIIGFAMVSAPLSYLAAAPAFPLQDAMLDAWDRRLGIDWASMISFISQHSTLQYVLLLAYGSFSVQTIATVLILGITGRLVRLNAFVHAFIAMTLIAIVVSIPCPAAGPWLFLDLHAATENGFLPSSASSWPVFLGLRDGTLSAVQGLHSEGIITFPSLHAALGILFSVAVWPVKRLRWSVFGLNGLMLLATPACGSHYVVDVIAGILLAAVCWTTVARQLGATPVRLRPATIEGSPSLAADRQLGPAQHTFSREVELV
ncbi:MAG TPA: phosphatase PAP2 family protein [Bradyrhizobium sp.]|nr:phosphatase PAP2 family protein [Bradyrhizobium sp.]